jgi:hypothetical protein
MTQREVVRSAGSKRVTGSLPIIAVAGLCLLSASDRRMSHYRNVLRLR